MKRSLVVIAFVVTACGGALAQANPAFEPLGRESQLFVVDMNGKDVIRLTRDDENHAEAAWSRDGRLAFLSSAGGSVALEIMRLDGGDRRVLLQDPVLSWGGLSWSPDGRRLAFATFLERGSRQRVETVAADGSQRTRIAEYVVPWNGPFGPSWSHDGTRLAYARGSGTGPPRVPPGPRPGPAVIPGTMKIVVADAAGRRERRLTRLRGEEWNPQWSPRGESILFSGGTRGERVGLFAASPEGKARLLAGDLIFIYDAAWSPDARAVALLATPYVGDRRTRLLLVDVRTRNVRTLAHADVASARPSWSPNGRQIAYAASDGIRIVTAADGHTELLLSVPAQVGELAWSPDGAWLAFTAQRVPED